MNLCKFIVSQFDYLLILTVDVFLNCIDKGDSSFCRSQSSSASSLDNIVSKEAIQCLTFAETFARKSGTAINSNTIQQCA